MKDIDYDVTRKVTIFSPLMLGIRWPVLAPTG